MRSLLRKLRGALGNAVVWGMAWFGASVAILTALTLAGFAPPSASWEFVLRLATNIGITGFVAGGGFSVFLGIVYRRRRLEDIRVGRIALGGAMVAGLISPLVSIVAIGISGSGIGFGFLAANATWSALFGGLTAGGTVKLSKHSLRRLDERALTHLGELGAQGHTSLGG